VRKLLSFLFLFQSILLYRDGGIREKLQIKEKNLLFSYIHFAHQKISMKFKKSYNLIISL